MNQHIVQEFQRLMDGAMKRVWLIISFPRPLSSGQLANTAGAAVAGMFLEPQKNIQMDNGLAKRRK
ncbi:MAG TPA: hypothetical protein VIK53_03000 [Verrucomicrobiae bacterium]